MDFLVFYVNLVVICVEVVWILVVYGKGMGYVFNFGYGIILEVDLVYVGVFFEVVYELLVQYYG